MTDHRTSVAGDLVRGALAGAAGTWVMDLVTTGLLQQASQADRQREQAAMVNGKSSVRNLVDLALDATGLEAPEEQRNTAATATHWALGVVPGAFYGVLRNRVPGVGAFRGIAYGLLLWGANDEYLNTALGLAAPPDAYPTSTHVRGLVGHIVLGATTDTVLDLLGG